MAKGKRKKQVRTRSYRRQHRQQRARKSILIVCEGKKTEPIYFESLCSELTLPLVTPIWPLFEQNVYDKGIQIKTTNTQIHPLELTSWLKC